MYKKRLVKMEQLIVEYGFGGAILNPGASLVYLTGLSFHLMERPVIMIIVPGSKPVIILPELEKAKLDSLPFDCTPIFFGDNPVERESAFLIARDYISLDDKDMAVEPTRLRFLELEYLKALSNKTKVVDGSPLFDNLRACKDDSEIEMMSKAVDIAQKAFTSLLSRVRIGETEKALANELTTLILKFGSDPELPFQAIFSSGPNSANPHAVPSDRKLQLGDLVVVDWGASYNGYASDLTRTLVLGNPSTEQNAIAESVLRANTAGRGAGKPGIAAGEVDRAARNEIEHDGFGEYFTHRTGHGLGMEAHETPYMFGENKQILEPGMVYTVEPGIYLPEKGGVRIEDDVVVTSSGSRSLSDLPRELYIIR
jgi:Xaa-Pro dipeptidase